MKTNMMRAGIPLAVLFSSMAYGQPYPQKTMSIHLEGATLPAVSLSHTRHEQAKITCTQCHHAVPDKSNGSCSKCHSPKEAKEVLHIRCQSCHKAESAKGHLTPVKCMECHKK